MSNPKMLAIQYIQGGKNFLDNVIQCVIVVPFMYYRSGGEKSTGKGPKDATLELDLKSINAM